MENYLHILQVYRESGDEKIAIQVTLATMSRSFCSVKQCASGSPPSVLLVGVKAEVLGLSTCFLFQNK